MAPTTSVSRPNTALSCKRRINKAREARIKPPLLRNSLEDLARLTVDEVEAE